MDASISVDGGQRFQHIDGFGVNANPKNFTFSDLRSPIDLLVDDLHASLWRVDIDGNSNWIDDASQLNAAYYSTVYETPDFQALWQTLDYLNARGAAILLSASGVVPTWMGGTYIAEDHEDQFVEMITSVVDYGRRVRGIPILLLSPLNETDIGAPEGPLVGPDQYARLLNKIHIRLHELGYDDVRLVAPEIANVDAAATYVDPIVQDPMLVGAVGHFAFHNYFGWAGHVDDLLAGFAYPDRTYWMTEWSEASTDGFLDNGHLVQDEWQFARSMTDELLALLQQGTTAALAWDAWDNVHEHCRCKALSHWGLLALDPSSNSYHVASGTTRTRRCSSSFLRDGPVST